MKTFIELIRKNLLESNAISSAEAFEVHMSGETAAAGDAETLEFIRETNLKYHNINSDVLKGTFLRIYTSDSSFIRVYVEDLYETYKESGIDSVMKNIQDSLSYSAHLDSYVSNSGITAADYAAIKDKLIIRPLNYEQNAAALEGRVYKRVGDIALVLYFIVLDDEQNGCINTVKIPEEIFEKWGLTFDEVFERALINTANFAPARIYTNILGIESTPDSASAFMSEDYEGVTSISDTTIPLVTTERKTNGAVVMFYPGVKEKLSEMFGGTSFYVAFTSIHEAMLHKEGTVAPESIKRHIIATNNTFGAEDTLTSEVWYYNAEDGTFDVVDCTAE